MERLATLMHSALSTSVRHGGPAAPAIGDLFSLANAIASNVGGAVAIEDVQQRILAYSTLHEQPIDEDRRQGILGLEVPTGPENGSHYHELYSTNRVCRFTSGAASPRIAIAVRAASSCSGQWSSTPTVIWALGGDCPGRGGQPD